MRDQLLLSLERLGFVLGLIALILVAMRFEAKLDDLKADIARPVPACQDCSAPVAERYAGGVR